MKSKLVSFFILFVFVFTSIGITTSSAQEFLEPPLIYCDHSEDFKGVSVVQEKLSFAKGRLLQPTSEIRVTYIDFPDDAKAAFERAVAVWEHYISSPIPIFIEVKWTGDLPDQTLASSAATRIVNNFSNAPFRNVWYVIPLAESLAGRDLNDGTADIKINLNKNINWHTSEDSNPGPAQYDLTAIALHEICHGLGFSSSMKVVDGEGIWGQNGLAYIYDLFLIGQSNQKLADPGNIGNPSTELADLLTDNELRFEISDTFYDQEAPRLSSENPFTTGVSTSHLDEEFYPSGNPFSLMTPQVGRAEIIRDPGTITLFILKEMGWVIANLRDQAPLSITKEKVTPKLFPNPATGDHCQVLIPDSQKDSYDTFKVFSGNGLEVSGGNIEKENRTQISLTGLLPGVYFVKLSGVASPSWLRLLKL